MRAFLFVSLLAAAFVDNLDAVTAPLSRSYGPFPPGTAASGGVRNMALVYLDGRSLPDANDATFHFDAVKFERLVGYKPAGTSRAEDALFDGTLLIGYDWVDGKRFWPGVGKPLNASDWQAISALWRTQGLEALSNATRAVNADLNTTLPNVKLYVTIPYPDRRQQHFGDAFSTCRGGAARSLNFSVDADRLLATQCWVAHIIHDWPTLPGVSMTGFYWFLEDMPSGDEPLVRGVADFIKTIPTHGEPSLKFTWIPYYNMAVHEAHLWRSLGFDFATIQPNVAFNDCDPAARFAEMEHLIVGTDTGVEMELPLAVRNPTFDHNATRSFDAYYDAALRYNWTGRAGGSRARAVKTFYYGNAFVEMATSADAALNALYVKIHDLVCDVGESCLRFA